MIRFAALLLNGYLRIFAVFASDRQHALREHQLLVGSIQYVYEYHRAQNDRALRAALRTFWAHLGELQPIALYQKTNADAAYASTRATLPAPFKLVIAASALGVLVVTAVLLTGGTILTALIALPPVAGAFVLGTAIILRWRKPGVRWALLPVVALLLWPWLQPRIAGAAADTGAMFTIASIATLVSAAAILVAQRIDHTSAGRIGLLMLCTTPIAWNFGSLIVGHSASGLWLASVGVSQGEAIVIFRGFQWALHSLLLTLGLWRMRKTLGSAPGASQSR